MESIEWWGARKAEELSNSAYLYVRATVLRNAAPRGWVRRNEVYVKVLQRRGYLG